jgi:hypothetical protein
MAYDKGDKIRSTATFTNTAGANTDPTTIKFKFTTPAGVTTTYTYGVDAQVVKSATGIYYADTEVTAGTWHCRWEGTGTVVAAVETSFLVQRSNFP